MNPATAPLAQLRDIHLPSTVGLWPPAPGWWILAILVIAAGVFVWRFFRTRRQASAYRRDASALRQHHWADFSREGDVRRYLQNLQVALRRIALSFEPSSATLTGDEWLNFLDDTSPEKPPSKQALQQFQSELGHILLTEAYRKTPKATDAQLQELHNLALHWAHKHSASKKPSEQQEAPKYA